MSEVTLAGSHEMDCNVIFGNNWTIAPTERVGNYIWDGLYVLKLSLSLQTARKQKKSVMMSYPIDTFTDKMYSFVHREELKQESAKVSHNAAT